MTRAVVLLSLCSVLQAQPASDPASAERLYEQEVKVRPSAENWQRLGLARHLQNKFEAAIPAWREATRLDPSRWTAHLFLGIALYRTNQFPASLASLEKADSLAPETHQGRDDVDYWLGAARIASNQPLKGLESLERLLRRNPKHVDALELSVRTYADLSSRAWNDVAEKSFATAAGQEVHGYALESEGNHAGALEAFRESKALNPGRAGPGLAIGRLLLRQQKADEALGVLRDELKLPDADPEASYYAGLAAIQLDRYSEAARLLEAAAKSMPRYAEAPLAQAQVYLALKEPAKAIIAARKATEIDPSSAVAHDLLVAALTQAGESQQAEAEKRRWSERSLR